MDDDLQVDTKLMSAFTPQTLAVEAGVGVSVLLFLVCGVKAAQQRSEQACRDVAKAVFCCF